MIRILFYLTVLLYSGPILAAKQPNVLIIVSDDMGWADIGYVNPKVKTPNLDRLASEGVCLERFYANPLCSVTQAALMTGRTTLVTGVSNRRGLPLLPSWRNHLTKPVMPPGCWVSGTWVDRRTITLTH